MSRASAWRRLTGDHRRVLLVENMLAASQAYMDGVPLGRAATPEDGAASEHERTDGAEGEDSTGER